MNKVIAIIPARYRSSRFPGKALADIFGKPMVYWVYTRVAKSQLLDQCVVATDDKRIVEACEQYNIPVIMTSEEHVNGTERVAEVARMKDADIIINVQGDEPLITPETVDVVVKALQDDPTLEYVQAAKRIEQLTDLVDATVVKIAVAQDGRALYLSRSPIPYPRATHGYAAYKHIGVYGYRAKFLFEFVAMGESPLEKIEGIEQLRALEYGRVLKIVEVQHDTVSIDTPADLERIKKEYAHEFINTVV